MKKINFIFLIFLAAILTAPSFSAISAKEKIKPPSKQVRIYYNSFFKTEDFQGTFPEFQLKTFPVITKIEEAQKIVEQDPRVKSLLEEEPAYTLMPDDVIPYTDDYGKRWHGLIFAIGQFVHAQHSIREDYFFEVDPITKKVVQIEKPVTYIEFDPDPY